MPREKLSVGDPIQVRRMFFDHGEIEPWWVPATVQYVDDRKIVAVYADGQRHTVEHKNVRPAGRSALSKQGEG